jgi:L-lactate dehydrogenase
MKCTFKVAIVGVGKVGATTAFSLLHNRIVTDLVLVANDTHKAEGELFDLEQSLPFLQSTNISVTNDYQQIGGAALTIVTAGVAQKPGQTRVDLLKENLALFSKIIPAIYEANPEGLILIVTNPVDILTFHANQLVEARYGQIFGSGTVLDTARFRTELSKLFEVNPRSIHAYVLGEHGDSSFPVLSGANIGGQSLATLPKYSLENVRQAFDRAKKAAYQIIERKGATYYAIATVISHIVSSIYADAKTVMPVSVPLYTYQGIEDINMAASVPCIVGERGVEQVISVPLDQAEKDQLGQSFNRLKTSYQQILAA